MYTIKPIIDPDQRIEIKSSMYSMKMIYDLTKNNHALSDVSASNHESVLSNSAITQQINILIKVQCIPL